MSVLREIGIIARALDSIANIEFRNIELARGQYLYFGANSGESRDHSRGAVGASQGGSLNGCPFY